MKDPSGGQDRSFDGEGEGTFRRKVGPAADESLRCRSFREDRLVCVFEPDAGAKFLQVYTR